MTSPNHPDRTPPTPGHESTGQMAHWSDRYDPHYDDGSPLPFHRPTCLGCGPDNPCGHHIEVYRDGDGVRTRHTFDERHMGAPGIAHGGAVATVFDDLCGFVLYLVGEPAVTGHLGIDYLAPVLVSTPYDLHARLDRREGRKLYLTADAVNQAGEVVARAEAIFVIVPMSHFAEASKQSSPPVAP